MMLKLWARGRVFQETEGLLRGVVLGGLGNFIKIYERSYLIGR